MTTKNVQIKSIAAPTSNAGDMIPGMIGTRGEAYDEYNNKALEIARRIDRFAPAVLNGEKVRCKTIFPIIFSFSKPKE